MARGEKRKKAILEIVKSLVKIKGAKELDRLKRRIARKYRLSRMPLNAEILALAPKKYRSILKTKPTRSLSGVCVVAVMCSPHKCPGTCIYCPKGKYAPQSYTGLEPAARRAKRYKYEPFLQVRDRLNALSATGHSPSKVELIIMGGTFLSTTLCYQEYFVTRCFQAMNTFPIKFGKHSYYFQHLSDVKKLNEKAGIRCVGLTIESRPDWCKQHHIDRMLFYGATRCELGVQTTNDEILKMVRRGHDVNTSIEATRLLKDSGFKVLYHMMPGLPGSDLKADVEMFREIFENPSFRPDMLKIYPTSVVKGTVLYELYRKGEYEPPKLGDMVKVISEVKKFIPAYVRVMRVQRDIPSTEIYAGVKKTNLRELVQDYCRKNRIKCSCIRCREAGLVGRRKKVDRDMKLSRIDYGASEGKEVFLSFESKNALFGFLRLRLPARPHRKELKNSAIVRELHVYGEQVPVGKESVAWQHTGLGRKLLKKAEDITKKEFKKKRLAVISGAGARGYYKKFGYRLSGPYMVLGL